MDRQIDLTYMYMNGKGVPQDYSEAVKWLRMAAKQGDTKTQLNLGYMYDEVEGAIRNKTGFVWIIMGGVFRVEKIAKLF